MGDSPEQIAEGLQRLRKAIEAIGSQARKIEAQTSGLPAEWAKEIVRLTGGLIE